MRIFLLLPLAAISGLVPLYVFADTKDPKTVVAEIEAQLSRGRSEYRACGRFKKKFRKIVPGGLTIESPSHLSKKQALEYLAVLEKYPDRALGFDKALELYRTNLELFLQDSDQVEHLKRVGELEEDCSMFSVFVHAVLLFRDVKAFDLSKKERARVDSFARRYLKLTGTFESLPEAGVRGKVLEAYIANLYEGPDRDSLLARAGAYMKDIDMKRESVLEQRMKLKTEGKSDTLEYFRADWDSSAAAEATYAQLAKDAKL